MKPLFVSFKDSQRVINWWRLAAFSALVLLLAVVLVEGVWYMATHAWSPGALVVALVLAAPVVVRLVIRSITYQEQECEESELPSRTV